MERIAKDILNDSNRFQIKYLKRMPLRTEDFEEMVQECKELERKYNKHELAWTFTYSVIYIESVNKKYVDCNF